MAKGEWFVERAEQVGLQFTHVNGMSGKWYQAEIETALQRIRARRRQRGFVVG